MSQVRYEAAPRSQLVFISRQWMPILAVWGIFTAILYVLSYYDPAGYGQSAFDVYYKGAKALLSGQPLYSGTIGWPYLYPPLTAQVLMPFAPLAEYDHIVLSNGWFFLNIALMVLSLVLVNRYIPPRWWKALWIAPILFIPIGQAIYIGQITIIMLALITGAWVAVRNDQREIAGGLIALAAWIKVFPAILVIYFLWRRDWRVMRGVVFVGMGLAVAQILASGLDVFINFFGVLLTLTAGGQPDVTFENSSIFAFVSRLFQQNTLVQPLVVNDLLFSIGRAALTLGVIGTAIVTVMRSSAQAEPEKLTWRFDLEYGLLIVTILLFGSTLWVSGMPPLLLVYALILRNLSHYRHPRRVKWLAVGSFALISLYLPVMLIYRSTGETQMNPFVLSLGFFGVMILWALPVYLLNQRRTTA